jgi:outer membrane protein TolC
MLDVELRQRRGDVDAGRAALAASAEAVSAATEARRVIAERFKAGVATSTDVLDAENALLEAELERTRLAATLRVSEARLLRAVGGE